MTRNPFIIILFFIMLAIVLVAGCTTAGPKPVTNGTSDGLALSNSDVPITLILPGNMGEVSPPPTTIASGTLTAPTHIVQRFTQAVPTVRRPTIIVATDTTTESTPVLTSTTDMAPSDTPPVDLSETPREDLTDPNETSTTPSPTQPETFLTDTPDPIASATKTKDSGIISFSASEIKGPAPLTVRFTDSSTVDISNHLWNFGDNEYEVGSRDPVHTYTKPGRYTVVLAATTSDGGGKTMTMTDSITVTQTDPAPLTSGVSVAASNSQVKDTTEYICDGSNDQTEIQEVINSVATRGGGDVYLLDGTFNVDGDIHLTSGVNLIGQGAGITTLNFVGDGWIQVDGSNTVKDLQATGATGFLIVGSHVQMTSVTVRDYTTKEGAFFIYANNQSLIDFTFTNCNAVDGWSHGFINVGDGSSNSISDISYNGCSAINAGRASQLYPWVNGFTLAESTTINNLLIDRSWADGCWESGFYLPEGLDEKDITIKNCISTCNGQKRTIEEPHYGAGFFGGSPTVRFIECLSQNNKDGFSLRNGATAIHCKDIGSVNGFLTADNAWITLTDCKSDLAQEWALLGINSHDVTATNFVVTNPKGNPYPAVLAGSTKYPSYNMIIETTAT